MVKNRDVVLAIILTIITCGIYGIYWQCVIQDESLNAAKENGPSGIVVLLLSIITFGIYGIYWSYVLGERIGKLSNSSNMGLIYLLLTLFGFGFINIILAQIELNKHVTA